jgi:hypothetical protein
MANGSETSFEMVNCKQISEQALVPEDLGVNHAIAMASQECDLIERCGIWSSGSYFEISSIMPSSLPSN